MTECSFYKRACQSGCEKAYCRAFFPEKSPLVMEGQKSVCLSEEYKECLIRLDGLAYQKDRIDSKKGCQFASNSQCGHPDKWVCKGHVPPFTIEGDNLALLSACFGNDYPECDNYKMGIKFRIEANRISKMREEEAKNGST